MNLSPSSLMILAILRWYYGLGLLPWNLKVSSCLARQVNNKVKRLLALSTPSYWVGVRDVSSWKLTIYGMMPKLFASQGNAEMVRIAETVTEKAAHLDWTIFRIPHLIDGAAELPVWAGYAGPTPKGGLNLLRRSLARWVLGEITEGEGVKGVPFLRNY